MPRHRTENHELQELRELVAWIGEHIRVRSAGMSKATRFCGLCSGITKLRRGACRHDAIWDIGKKFMEDLDKEMFGE